MILQSLRDLAKHEGLVDDPAFESKPVRWVVALKSDGSFVSVYDTNQTPLQAEGKKSKPRPQARMMVIPRRRGRTVNIAADFLVDKAEYALELVPEGGPPTVKTQQRHADFKRLLQEAAISAPDPLIAGVLLFLEHEQAKKECASRLLAQGDFATNDLFSFEIDGEYVQDSKLLRRWWTDVAGAVAPSSQAEQQCLMCGSLCTPVEKHNLLQIAGGVSSGVPLVSFNSSAFEKYGWEGSRNAPMCSACMTAYVEGLRRLTKPRYVLPRTGDTVGPLSTRLNESTTAVYWAEAESDLVSFLPFLRDDPKKVADLLVSPHRGSRISVGDAERFYCLILSGAQGRAIVRKIHTGTVGEVERNLRCYFAAMDVERFDRTAPIPLYRLLQSMVLQGKLDRLPSNFGSELWLAALFGLPLSRLFLATLIARNRAERAVPAERAALLQFYFANRNKRPNSFTKGQNDLEAATERESSMSLDVESKDPPYLSGRLLAVLENIQAAAQSQGLNRTIVDRFYGTASTRPSVVFPQLLKLGQQHLSKAAKRGDGRARFLDRELSSIMDAIEVGGFKTTLNLEQQGNFALGYYHQRQSFYKKREAVTEPITQPNAASIEHDGESNA